MGRGPLKGALSRPKVKITSSQQQCRLPAFFEVRSILLELSNLCCLPGRAGGSLNELGPFRRAPAAASPGVNVSFYQTARYLGENRILPKYICVVLRNDGRWKTTTTCWRRTESP